MIEHKPLAEMLRPQKLDDVIGQEHLVGPNGIIRKMLAVNFLPSIIFWGPPGSGKTTIARLLSDQTQSYFIPASAVTTKLEDVRKIISEAKIRIRIEKAQRTILFIDELHRFNKAQQDAFLPHVEDGTIIFIGATTENPSFEVISPLLSRCRVLVVNPLNEIALNTILNKALKHLNISIESDAKEFLLEISNGDARSLISILEIADKILKFQNPGFRKNSGRLKDQKPKTNKNKITVKDIEQAAQQNMLQYDRLGDDHYNTISAFIKSMRASQTDAALYYLARMVASGEDPLFIARRMVIFASEDIGMAQPTALVVANEVFQACHQIGYPECQENLAHGVVYLSLAKKDRSAYDAYMAALFDVKKYGNLPIPKNILNAPTKLMKSLDYSKGYNMYDNQSFLPEKLRKKEYWKKTK